MAQSSLESFSCALITGGSRGLGRAMASSLIAAGKKVIIAGRTESKLQSAAKEIGASAYYVLDTGDVSTIRSFTDKLVREHPDLDCLINNAGVQRPFRFPGTESASGDDGDNYTFDLAKADNEIAINIRGPMHLVVSLLPHLQALAAQGQPSAIMNVSSILGYVPTSVINPVYNGTKAWLHFFTMSLRSQLTAAGFDGIKVIEIAPPSVGTDLHRERANPDDNKDTDSAMTVDGFMKEVERGWSEGKEVIAPGPAGATVEKWYGAFGEGYAKAVGS